MPSIDPAEYRKHLDHLTSTIARMVVRAEELSTRRCPYRNRFDECTAMLACRNKRRAAASNVPVCGGDGQLDY